VFTGLITELGRVENLERTDAGARVRIAASLSGELGEGDSVAVNGVCLTAASVSNGTFEADVVNQTLELTSLGDLEAGDAVNLELPLRAADRLGGHVVQGHVDAAGEVLSLSADGIAKRVRISAGREQLGHLVERGSVAVDGVSLTVTAVGDGWFEVSLIPETIQRTNLGRAQPGTRVNLETDILARYVAKHLEHQG
jgi:riboflavin synthase